jgi:hypothetical protein
MYALVAVITKSFCIDMCDDNKGPLPHDADAGVRPNNANLAQIIPNLFLSSIVVAMNKQLLNELKITHIINATGPKASVNTNAPTTLTCSGAAPALEPRHPNAFPSEFQYLNLNIADEQDVLISDYFEISHKFIDQAIKDGGNVLVHCEAGISRSSTIVISYLMASTHQTLKPCLDLVKRLKPNIGPNKSFFQQLLEFERKLFPVSGTFPTESDSSFAAVPSISLREYLTDQLWTMMGGMYGRSQIEDALANTHDNLDMATNLLFDS